MPDEALGYSSANHHGDSQLGPQYYQRGHEFTQTRLSQQWTCSSSFAYPACDVTDKMASNDSSSIPIVLAALVPVLTLSFGLLGYCWWRGRHKKNNASFQETPAGEQLATLAQRVEANAEDVRKLSRALEAQIASDVSRGDRAAPKETDGKFQMGSMVVSSSLLIS